MSFLICGASFTFGDGLDNPIEQAWPAVFSKKINQPVVNIATIGASVDYVIYRTMQELNKPYDVIVAWPSLLRTLMVRRENNFLINGNATFANDMYGNTKEFKDYLSYHYKYWTNELFDLKNTLQKIVLFQSYLSSKKCKYLFINSDPYNLTDWLQLSSLSYEKKQKYLDAFEVMDDQQIQKEELEINELYKQLNLQYYYQPTTFNLTDACQSQNLIDYRTKHPTVAGQEYLAETVFNIWSQL
jgi:hypothetical protein